MKRLTTLALLAWSSFAMAQTEKLLPDFKSIEMDIPVKLVLKPGDAAKAESSHSLKGLSFEVKNDVLEINLDGNEYNTADPVTITFKQIERVELNGASSIETAKGTVLKSDKFRLECNGAAKGNLFIEAKDVLIESNGASKLTLAGSADRAKFEATGASKLYASEFKTKELTLEASGASYFEVFASDRLMIEGSGAVKGSYKGNPPVKVVNVSGISKVIDSTTGEKLSDERNGSNDDTTRIAIGKKKFIIIDNDDEIKVESDDKKDKSSSQLKRVYTGFELGMSGLTTPSMNFNMDKKYEFLNTQINKSWFYGLNILEGDLTIIPKKLALTSGFGMEFQHFEFNTDRVLTPNVSAVSADSGLVSLSQNRMYNFNLSAPVLLKFAPHTKKGKEGFHLAVGVIGTYKAYSQVRLETSANGYDQLTKNKDDYNINPFRLAATVRVGYGWFRAFANYSLTPYFNTGNNNPDVRSFTAGITLIPFKG